MQSDADTVVLDIESTALSGALPLTGTRLVIGLTELNTQVNGLVRVHFGENVKFADTDKLTVTALTNAGQTVGYFVPTNERFLYFNIPDPATNTLFLLALSTLAARRNRNPTPPAGRPCDSRSVPSS